MKQVGEVGWHMPSKEGTRIVRVPAVVDPDNPERSPWV